MEKLIELFKEYVDNYGTDTHDLEKEYGVIDDGQGFLYGTREYSYLTLISKSFGFIKWLVENDKIDSGTRNPLFITELVGEQEKQIPYSFYEEMLIRLALSENPIEDLISYLDLSKS